MTLELDASLEQYLKDAEDWKKTDVSHLQYDDSHFEANLQRIREGGGTKTSIGPDNSPLLVKLFSTGRIADLYEGSFDDFCDPEYGPGATVAEAYYNAEMRGNNPIELMLYESEAGVIVAVEDSGKGFDPDGVHQKFEAREDYFVNLGGGWQTYDASNARVAFDRLPNGLSNKVVIYIKYADHEFSE